MTEHPKGWVASTLGDLGQWSGGGTPSKQRSEFWTNGTIPWVSPKDMKTDRLVGAEDLITPAAVSSSATQLLPPGCVLVVTRSGILSRTLPIAINDVPVALNQDIKALRPNAATSPDFVRYFLRGSEKAILQECSKDGTTVASVSTEALQSFRCDLPPLSEQRRIVEKLDVVFDKSRAAKARLERLPGLLEKLKRSILAAAFRGDLTKEWRAAHPDVEPASVLLERIRAERRRRWEEGLRAKGKDPKKATYEEPAPVDVEGLPELPEGWAWARLPDLGEMSRGKSRHRPRNDPRLLGDRIPFIQTGEVSRSGGRITSWGAMYSDFGLAQSRVFPAGTVCITIAASIAESGILGFDACFPDSVVGVNVDRRLATPEFVEFFLRTARDDLARFAPATAQANINLEILSDVAVPIPPRAETDELTRLLDVAFAGLVGAGARWDGAAAAIVRLEQAALAKAFRGELVAQDPQDEPASVLLERIRAARADALQRVRRGFPATGRRASKPPPRSPSAAVAEADVGLPADLVAAAFQQAKRLTATAIGEATGLDGPSIKKALKELVDAGQVRVEGRARGTAYEWVG